MWDPWGENYEMGSCTFAERSSFFSIFPQELYLDSCRCFYPDDVMYTFYAYAGNSRKKGRGLRLDYFMVDRRLMKYLRGFWVDESSVGSDHLLIGIDLEFPISLVSS